MRVSSSDKRGQTSVASILLSISLLLTLVAFASVDIVPPPGSLNTLQLYDDSAVVCRGTVYAVTELQGEVPLVVGRNQNSVRKVATVDIQRAYKGTQDSKITVLLEEAIHAARPKLKPGDYVLLFLSRMNDSSLRLDARFFVSANITGSAVGGFTGFQDDLVQGLTDRDSRRAVANFQLLEGLQKIPSLEPVKPLTASPTLAIAAHAHLLMLRNGDTSLSGQMFDILERIPVENDAPLLQIGVAAHALLEGPAKRTTIIRLSKSKHRPLRIEAMYALSEMNDPSTVPALMSRIDDQSRYIGFLAIKTLAQITGKKAEEYLPAFGVYDKDPGPYNTLWKKWWAEEGKARYVAGQ